MSKYTTELRFICENYAGYDESTGLSNVDDVIEKSRSKVFDFDFPIFDESYRNILENKILMHYYTREIASETVGLWKFWLRTKMNEIMPYYNQLYRSATLEFNPFYDVDLTTDSQRVNNGQHSNTNVVNQNDSKEGTNGVDITTTGTHNESSQGSNMETNSSSNNGTEVLDRGESSNTNNTDGSKNDHWEYFSETPEGGINGIQNLNYLTTALHTTDDRDGSTSSSTNSTDIDSTTTVNNSGTSRTDGTDSRTGSSSDSGTENRDTEYSENGTLNRNTTDNGTIKNIEDYLHHVKGKSGGASYSKLLEEYRKTFLNIDMMIIGELKNLFIQLW